MMKRPFSLPLGLISLLMVTALPIEVQAKSPATNTLIAASPSFQLARSRKRLSWRVGARPSRFRVGGWSRSDRCLETASATAFVPPPRPEEKVVRNYAPIDKTLSGRPTLWFNLSGIPKNTTVQFTLQDAAGNKELYNTRFQFNGQSGIVGVPLPSMVSELKVGEKYLWQLGVKCSETSRPDEDIAIGSWIERVTPDLIPASADFNPRAIARELASAPEQDKPALYASMSVWQDAVTSLVSLMQKQPNSRELKEDWNNLLTGGQVSEFANTPIFLLDKGQVSQIISAPVIGTK